MHEFYDNVPELIRSNPKLALATIVQAKGSTPRGVGAKMAVFPDDFPLFIACHGV